MAFEVVQEFNFEKLEYSYDRRGDVLEISFGPPVPAIALQVEDWLAIRMRAEPPYLQGMTVVGFKRLFEKINRYVEEELPQRMKRLAGVKIKMWISYDDNSDALIYHWEENRSAWHRLLEKLFIHRTGKPSIFEPFLRRGDVASSLPTTAHPLENVYVEKSLPSKDIVGMKILEFTKCGPAALEGIFGAIIDTILEPTAEYDDNVHQITDVLIQCFDWQKLEALAA
ncbi:MAG: hypothetical protein HYS61_08135 [Acidobacteria bacterium]|nr:hypothetical protein [Acidobacteriota bacterium]